MTTNNKENVMLEEMKKEIKRVKALWVCVSLKPERTLHWMGSYLETSEGIVEDAKAQRKIASFR
jgi:hypothetical protein